MVYLSPSNGRVTLRMLIARGIEVASFFEGEAAAGGMIQVTFNTDGLAKGLHFSKLEINGITQSVKNKSSLLNPINFFSALLLALAPVA